MAVLPEMKRKKDKDSAAPAVPLVIQAKVQPKDMSSKGYQAWMSEPMHSVCAVIQTLYAFLLNGLLIFCKICQWLSGVCQLRCQEQKVDFLDDPSYTGPSVAFSGCAFWWPYMAGICQYLFEEFDLANVRILSTSASSFPVISALVGVNPFNWCIEDYPKCLGHWYARPCLSFIDSTKFCRELWHNFLPKDAHKLVEGRLAVSVTRLACNSAGLPCGVVNEQVSEFQSNDELVDTLMATINVPGVFFRGSVRRGGYLSFDGAYSEGHRLPNNKSVIINLSPLTAASDIVPTKRLPWYWLLIPQTMERTKLMYRWGYEDARTNHSLFESRGWRPKTAGPASRND